MSEERDKWMTTIEVAEALGVSRYTVQRRVRLGQIPSMKLGEGRGTYLFKPSDIAKLPTKVYFHDLAIRREQVQQMRQEGQDSMAISAALGISRATVDRDLTYLSQAGKTDAPSTVTSTETDPDTVGRLRESNSRPIHYE